MNQRDQAFRERAMRIYSLLRPRAEQALRNLIEERQPGAKQPDFGGQLVIRNLGRAAGQVRGNVVSINLQLVDFQDHLSDTLAHELAHVVVDTARKHFGIRHRRGDWSPHGPVWKTVAQQLGDNGDRCHRLPLQPRHRVSRYLYRLPDGTERVLSAIRHNRLQRSNRNRYHFRGDSEPVRGLHFVAQVSS